jgi:hypothetical protein
MIHWNGYDCLPSASTKPRWKPMKQRMAGARSGWFPRRSKALKLLNDLQRLKATISLLLVADTRCVHIDITASCLRFTILGVALPEKI